MKGAGGCFAHSYAEYSMRHLLLNDRVANENFTPRDNILDQMCRRYILKGGIFYTKGARNEIAFHFRTWCDRRNRHSRSETRCPRSLEREKERHCEAFARCLRRPANQPQLSCHDDLN